MSSKYFNQDTALMMPRSTRSGKLLTVKNEENNNDSSQAGDQVSPGPVEVKSEPKWEPANWQEQLENIRQMRETALAPVDTMGCEKCYEGPDAPKLKRFHVLVSLMLSSQTKDEVNHAAMVRLKEKGLSPSWILSVDPDTLGELLKPVGFWRRKTEYLKRVSQILIDKYGGDIPPNFNELCELPGVGPKMAHLVMQVAWDEVTGIAVDTHVHRIANRLKWVKKTTKDPLVTEREIEDWIPRRLWNEINHLLVGFGQTICKPVGPKCDDCLNRNICPSSSAGKSKGTSKSKGKGKKVKSSDQV